MPDNPKPVRRIVVVEEGEKSKAIADGPSPDVRTDPARPGFASTRIWVTDRTPEALVLRGNWAGTPSLVVRRGTGSRFVGPAFTAEARADLEQASQRGQNWAH